MTRPLRTLFLCRTHKQGVETSFALRISVNALAFNEFVSINGTLSATAASTAQHMEKQMKEDTPSASRQQDETRKIGHQARLAEKVVDAAANKDAHQNAKNNRFAVTGEVSKAPKAADLK